MQEPHIKLREIIWEITGECKNNCTYCGSKSVWSKKNSNETILKIAEKIASHPPVEITISGGDPLLVETDIHEKIVNMFRNKNMICKILVNPKSLFSKTNPNEIDYEAINILSTYDWIGVSVNTKDELEKLNKYLSEYPTLKNLTIITNFNIQNLFLFDAVERFVELEGFAWTIQFTVYEKPSTLALYSEENSDAFSFLNEKYLNSSAKISLSDNIRNDMPCGAGWCSVGITYDGFVLPCLSMRSWFTGTQHFPSLLSDSLDVIWINGFKEQRFDKFFCCKDHCKNKNITPKKNSVTTTPVKVVDDDCVPTRDWKKELDEIIKEREKTNPTIPSPAPWPIPEVPYTPPRQPYPEFPQIIMYGVHIDPTTYGYLSNNEDVAPLDGE